VLETTGNFRSLRDVEELWDALVTRLTTAIQDALHPVADPESFLKVKESLLTFIMTLEVSPLLAFFDLALIFGIQTYSYSTVSLHSFIIVLFEKYAKLLETQFSRRFEAVSHFSLITKI